MSVQNPEVANEAAAALTDRREQTAEQRREGLSTAEKILNARQRKTVTLDLDGLDVDFQVMLGDERDEVADIKVEVGDLASKIESAGEQVEDGESVDVEAAIGMTEDEATAKVQQYRDRFVDILVEHAVDDSLTRAFWLEAYGRDGAGRLAMRLKEKSERADMTEDELEQFRRQRG